MERTLFHIPAMYGDHHVTAVRDLLLALPGVNDVYASAGFQQVVVSYDPEVITPAAIEQALAAEGYGTDAVNVTPPTSIDLSTRHTVAHSGTGRTMSFAVELPTWGSGALRPCPGFVYRDVTDEHPADRE